MIINKIVEYCIHLFSLSHLLIFLQISPRTYVLKKIDLGFSFIKLWFIDQIIDPLEILDKIK